MRSWGPALRPSAPGLGAQRAPRHTGVGKQAVAVTRSPRAASPGARWREGRQVDVGVQEAPVAVGHVGFKSRGGAAGGAGAHGPSSPGAVRGRSCCVWSCGSSAGGGGWPRGRGPRTPPGTGSGSGAVGGACRDAHPVRAPAELGAAGAGRRHRRPRGSHGAHSAAGPHRPATTLSRVGLVSRCPAIRPAPSRHACERAHGAGQGRTLPGDAR